MQTQAGTVRQIARYPVKSMRGEVLAETSLTLQGLPEDRRYAFVQAASRSNFPWFTGREKADLLLHCPAVERAGSPGVSVKVTTPSGEQLPVDSDELRLALEALWGHPLFLLRDYRGSYDVAPVSLISAQTIARIAQESGAEPDPWRFRPNLVIDLNGGEPFQELTWVGRVLRIGDTARVAITEVDQRCVMITLDPDTAQSNPAVLRYVAQQHHGRAGVYGTVLTPGEVRPGDPIVLES